MVDLTERHIAACAYALRDQNPDTRVDAARRLGLTRDMRAVDPLREALERETVRIVRLAIVEALKALGGEQSLLVLARTFDDADSAVRDATRSAFAAACLEARWAALLVVLIEGSASSRREAVEMLSRRPDSAADASRLHARTSDFSLEGVTHRTASREWMEIILHLRRGLNDSRYEMREASAQSLGRLRDKASTFELIAALDDEHHRVRAAAATALGQLCAAQAVPRLCHLLDDLAEPVRYAAACALGSIGKAEAVPALCARLERDHYHVTAAVIEALGRIGDPSAVPTDLPYLKSIYQPERRAAAEALGLLRDLRAGAGLCELLLDSDDEVRLAAAKSLGTVRWRGALPLLHRRLRLIGGESSPAVREAMRRSIAAIESKTALMAALPVVHPPSLDSRSELPIASSSSGGYAAEVL